MKKEIQRFLSAVLTLCTAFSLFSIPALAADSGTRDTPWDISADGTDSVTAWYEGNEQSGYTLHITGSGSMTTSFRNTAPWTDIKANITAVVVEEGVTNVGAYAFNFCRRLSSVSLPESLTEIGAYAFHATSVKRLTIPAGVNTLGRMISTPNTYHIVLGTPQNVDDHAFSTSLVSSVDKASAESLNSKTNVSAIIILDGGVYGETDEDLTNLSYGLITPVKEGYTFNGWYRDDGFVNPCKVSKDGRAVININNIYYAKWTAEGAEPPAPVKYTVTFDSQGGSAVASQTVTGEGTAVKPANPARTGYSFSGWFTDAACTTEWNFETAISQNITLYAKWTEIQPESPSQPSYPSYPAYPSTPESPSATEKPDTPVTPGLSNTTTTVTENEDGSTTVTVTDTETGTYTATTGYPDGSRCVTAKSPDGGVSIVVTNASGETVVDIGVPAAIPEVDNGFLDVPSGHYAEKAINQAVALGLINGIADNKFGTDTYLDRAMVATILCRLSDMEGKNYPNNFTDVPPGHYAKNAIAWANLTGIVKGYGETFAPGAEIKRQDLAVMLYRFAQLIRLDTTSSLSALDSFVDSDSISDYAREAMAWCVSHGIINGNGSGIIAPSTSTKRCDATLMFLRFIDLMK